MEQFFGDVTSGIAAAWHAFVLFMEYALFFGGVIVFLLIRKWLGLGGRSSSDGWDANNNVWGANDSNSRDVYHYPGPGGSKEDYRRMLESGRGINSK